MATVPASKLATITDRMPAILAPEDWATWLGEAPATPDEVKACLRTRDEPDWTMRPEEKGRRKPTPSNPKGLL
jgi:putative SOS response-associated peptidase YedK